jgi:hypothetical protein
MSLFHYTDANGLIGMLENKSLWVNDVNYMNDTHEIKHGLQVFRDEFTKHEGANVDATIWFLDVLIGNIYQIGSFLITSFCKENNILDMWRGYGISGQKYAIEFDEAALTQEIKAQYPGADIGFYDCVYGEHDSKELVESSVATWLSDDSAVTIDANGKATLNIPKMIQVIIKKALIMKNYGFESERERRLLVLMGSDFTQYNHRAGAFGITPYINLKFELDAVKSIKIGPTSNELGEMKSLNSIVRKIGMERPFPEEFITVSDITYR